MTAPEMPEPADGTALYWPPTRDPDDNLISGVVAVRDDTAPNSENDARWYAYGPGDIDGDPMTWADLWAWGHQYGAPVDEASLMSRPVRPGDLTGVPSIDKLPPVLLITVVDVETGETSQCTVGNGNYALVCTEPCRLERTDSNINGTTTLTLKGRNPSLLAYRAVTS